MGFFDKFIEVAGVLVDAAYAANAKNMRQAESGGQMIKIGDKTLREWENAWESIGVLSELDLASF